VIKPTKTNSTSNVLRHLRDSHRIIVKRALSEEEDQEPQIKAPTKREAFSALVTRIDVERFRYLLIRWIVQRQVPFSAVEHSQFRDILIFLQPSIKPYLVNSYNSIKAWVEQAYDDARNKLKSCIIASQSRVTLALISGPHQVVRQFSGSVRTFSIRLFVSIML
jgi:hypothetical protein